MVAKVSTIKKKLKSGKKLGFSERARAVNKGLIPSKAKKNGKKKEIQKSEQVENQRVLGDDYIQMRIQKTPLVSSSLQKQTQELRLQKLRESVNLLRERYRYLQSVSKEQK